jgi:hypothetical protein
MVLMGLQGRASIPMINNILVKRGIFGFGFGFRC